MSRSCSQSGACSQSGFTLTEMLVALGVLTFGVTSLIGVFGVGVAERRTAEQRMRAATLADRVLHRVENEYLANAPLDLTTLSAEDLNLEIEPVVDEAASEDPGMKYSVRFTTSLESALTVLVTVEVSWLEQGSNVAQKFHRVVSRTVPFSQRVKQHRSQS